MMWKREMKANASIASLYLLQEWSDGGTPSKKARLEMAPESGQRVGLDG